MITCHHSDHFLYSHDLNIYVRKHLSYVTSFSHFKRLQGLN